MATLEEEIINLAREKKIQIATAESCTGGLVANRLTNIAGSSDVYFGGFVTYHNQAKINLGVSKELIEKHGAVSSEVAYALAEKTLESLEKPGISIVTTGICGPTGGTDEKPVGLCHIGIGSTKAILTYKVQGDSTLSRLELKEFFSQKALEFAKENL